jgi:lauroyl/myristoyl acyltransferase
MKKVGLKLVNVLMFLVSILPFRVLYFLSDLLFYLIFYLVKYRRKVVQMNLLKSFPDKSKTERYVIEKRFYKHIKVIFPKHRWFQTSMFEMVHLKAFAISQQMDLFKYMVSFDNYDHTYDIAFYLYLFF